MQIYLWEFKFGYMCAWFMIRAGCLSLLICRALYFFVSKVFFVVIVYLSLAQNSSLFVGVWRVHCRMLTSVIYFAMPLYPAQGTDINWCSINWYQSKTIMIKCDWSSFPLIAHTRREYFIVNIADIQSLSEI